MNSDAAFHEYYQVLYIILHFRRNNIERVLYDGVSYRRNEYARAYGKEPKVYA